MKNATLNSLLFAVILTAGLFSSCRKDKQEDACAKVEYNTKATFAYAQPCGLAISKSGKLAIAGYNGFKVYGSFATTSIWNSYTDYVGGKAPMQTFQSRGAEALAFDANDNLYVSETEGTAGIRIYRKTSLGNSGVIQYQEHGLIQGGFVNPRGLAFDDNNRLFIANDGVGNVVRINDAFNNGVKQPIAASLGDVKGLAIQGNIIYMAIYSDNQVLKCSLKADGSFDDILGSYDVKNPVDVAIKDNVLAIASPVTGMITIIDADKMGKPNEAYTGCKKEIQIGSNTFGMAYTPDGSGLFASHLDVNQVVQLQK
jgi:hypothetical protein